MKSLININYNFIDVNTKIDVADFLSLILFYKFLKNNIVKA
jgi:hypothetical protein